MKFTEQEQLQQILLRSNRIRQKKDQRLLKELSASAAAIFCVLVAFIALWCRRGVAGIKTVYGSFLLSAEAGGYVLVAIVFFVIGVVITLLCAKHQKRKALIKKENHSDE